MPYRSIMQARAEHAVAKDTAFANALRMLRSYAAMLQVAKPGRAHPQGPMLPKPEEFYQPICVCYACYVVYSRLDAARRKTVQVYDEDPHPPLNAISRAQSASTLRPLPTNLSGAPEFANVVMFRPNSAMPMRSASMTALLKRETAVAKFRQTQPPLQLGISHRQLAHLNRDDTGPKQVKRMLMELDSAAAAASAESPERLRPEQALFCRLPRSQCSRL